MIDIKSMGYVRVTSTDLEAWRTFAEKVLGLVTAKGPNPEHLYYRIDEVSARLVVFPAEVDQLSCVGWELADHPALQAAREHLDKAGVEFEEGTAEELAERRVQELIRFSDPFDNVFELFHGITYESRPLVTPYAARFVTGDQGMGHVVIPVTDDVEALAFYRDVLGFRLRDSMSMPGEFVGREPGSKVWLRFLGVNPRHHSLAFLPMPNPSKCVHIMVEVEKLDDVGHAIDIWREVVTRFGDDDENVGALADLYTASGAFKDLAELLSRNGNVDRARHAERLARLADAHRLRIGHRPHVVREQMSGRGEPVPGEAV